MWGRVLKILHKWGKYHITKIVNCGFAYKAWWVIHLIPYGVGKSEPHQLCMQVNTYYSWICGLKSTSGSRYVHTSGPHGDYVIKCQALTISLHMS